MSATPPVPPEMKAALIETLGHPLRGRILTVIWERPGVSIKQIAERIDEPARKVRHQVDRLVESGLVGIDGETTRRNTRERHYRARVRRVTISDDEEMTADQRHRAATTVLRIIVDDLRGATGDRAFGTKPGPTEVRIPGEVDERGWADLVRILGRAMGEIEETMVQSALRLAAGSEPGNEVISALLLFEAPRWGSGDADPQPQGRASLWIDESVDPAA